MNEGLINIGTGNSDSCVFRFSYNRKSIPPHFSLQGVSGPSTPARPKHREERGRERTTNHRKGRKYRVGRGRSGMRCGLGDGIRRKGDRAFVMDRVHGKETPGQETGGPTDYSTRYTARVPFERGESIV